MKRQGDRLAKDIYTMRWIRFGSNRPKRNNIRIAAEAHTKQRVLQNVDVKDDATSESPKKDGKSRTSLNYGRA